MNKFISSSLVILLILFFNGTIMAEVYDGVDIPEGPVSFVDEVVSFVEGPNVDPEYADPQNSLGEPDYLGVNARPIHTVSLGDNGILTLKFTDNALTTSGDIGNDLWVFEIGHVEPSYISIATTEMYEDSNGTNWIDVGMIEGATAGVDLDAYLSSGVELWEKYSYIRITDAGAGLTTGEDYPGVDIDAVAAISSVPPREYVPVAIAGVDQQAEEGETVTLSGSNSLPPIYGSISSYSWTQTGSGTTVTLSDAATDTATFTAPTAPQSLTFQLTVTDNDADTDTDTTIVNIVLEGDEMPVASVNPVFQTVQEGETVTLKSNAYDPDGTIASYSWTQVSGTTVTLSGQGTQTVAFVSPNIGASGETLAFELLVTDDDGYRDSAYCIVNVSDVNRTPNADAGENQTVATGATVTLDGSGSSDPDASDTITYNWAQASGTAVTLSDPTSVQPTFTAPIEFGALEFVLTVVDNGGLPGIDTCIVNVTDSAASIPTADAGEDQTVSPGATVTLDASGSSDLEDGTDLEYFWIQVSGTAVSLSDPTATQPTFTAPDTGSTLEFRLTVTDSTGFKDEDTCIITIPGSGGDDDSNCFINSARWMFP